MIIPDLPFDNDEGLTADCRTNGMENIPVAAPSMSPERLSKLAHAGFPYIYAALRTGITGTNTRIDENTLQFLNKVSEGGSKIRMIKTRFTKLFVPKPKNLQVSVK